MHPGMNIENHMVIDPIATEPSNVCRWCDEPCEGYYCSKECARADAADMDDGSDD